MRIIYFGLTKLSLVDKSYKTISLNLVIDTFVDKQRRALLMDFHGKNVLVAGGSGMIGRYLVDMLFSKGARVRIASLDDPLRADPRAQFMRFDMRRFENCMIACENMDYVFNLLGVKGSPVMAKTRPATFFVTHLQFNTNLMEAARLSRATGFLYTSTYGVYHPASVLSEDDLWKAGPSENDKFAGWAKRMGELQSEACGIEYGWRASIVRPANVYGPYDAFGAESAMVVPSLIKRAVDGESPLSIRGDGTAVRDFIHAEDVAKGMLYVAEHEIYEPLNLGSGVGTSIRELAELIISNLDDKPEIKWNTEKSSGEHGDRRRVLDTSRAKSYGFYPAVSIEYGISETVRWYINNKDKIGTRYDAFRDG